MPDPLDFRYYKPKEKKKVNRTVDTVFEKDHHINKPPLPYRPTKSWEDVMDTVLIKKL